MATIPMRFKRITAAFDDVARARLCESSGSEHSAAEDSVADLSDLVDSFLERGDSNEGGDQSYDDESRESKKVMKKTKKKKKKKKKSEEDGGDYSESESYGSTEAETKEMLISLISGGSEEDGGNLRRMIGLEVDNAGRCLGNRSSEGFKRGIMTFLRQRGFDAGLCKSRWEKTGRHPAGEYEYIDIVIAKTRYIIEPSFTTELTIARPSKSYASLLEIVPQILVIREGELKQVLRLMCNAMRVSLRKRDLHVPPWRRNGYMQSKWFGSYKRTTNAVSSSKAEMAGGANLVGDLAGKSFVGFEPAVVRSSYCRVEVVRKVGGGVQYGGNLKAVFSGMGS